MNVDSCPDPDLLSSHLLGKVQGEHAETIDQHLASCKRCVEIARRVLAEDELTVAIRVGGPQLEGGENLAEIIERGKRLPESVRNTPFGDAIDVDSRGQVPGTPSDILQRESEIARDALENLGLGQQFRAAGSGDDEPPHLPRFRIERLLGWGGFGKVYLAIDEQLQRPVAVKVLHCRVMSQLDNAQAYLHEARTVANLDHPHIVPVFDVGSADHCPFYVVSKYVEGSDLSTLIQQRRFTCAESANLVATVAEALHYAHQRGLVHRDMKPGNILVDRDGRPYVVDFGLALREEQFGEGPRFLGTPPYLSPEQASGEGHRVDARADIYGLGAVLYEMLTGRPIFEGQTRSELLEQIASAEPIPPRQIDDSIPAELERVCCTAIAKRVAERYASAELMATDLRSFLAVHTAASRAEPADSVISLAAQTQVAAGGSTACEPAGGSGVVSGESHLSWAQSTAIGRLPKMPGPANSRTDRDEESAEPDCKPVAPRRSESLRHSPRLKVAALVLMMLGALGLTEASGVTRLGSTVIRLATGSGTLIIETDPGVTVSVDGEEVTIRGGGIEEFTLRPGDHKVAAMKDGRPLERQLVTITRNGRTTLRISLNGDRRIVQSADKASEDAALKPPFLMRMLPHPSCASRVVFSPDSRLLASGGRGFAYVWTARSGELRYTLPVTKGELCTIAFSPDGKYLLTAPEGQSIAAPISIWETVTGRPSGVLEGHTKGVLQLSFSADGKTLLSCGWDHFVRVWDFAARRKLRDIPSPSDPYIISAVFSSTGKIAFGRDKVFLAEPNGKLVRTIDEPSGHLRFSPDGRKLAGTNTKADGFATVWDVETGREIASWHVHDSVYDLTFSPDGNVIATSGSDGKVLLWDIKTQRQLAELSYKFESYGVAFSADGTTLATTGYEYLVRLWDVSAILAKQKENMSGARVLR